MRSLALTGLLLLTTACIAGHQSSAPGEPGGRKDSLIPYSIVRSYPHDTAAYTEGLLVYEGQLYESTGSPDNLPQTRSLFGKVDLATGRIEVKAELDRDQYFGEGIAFLGNTVYQLTFKSRTVFLYDARSFRPLGKVAFPSADGWGLTTDGVHLIMSNGSSKILFVDPATRKAVKTLIVRRKSGRVGNLNELELINGALYANVWQTNYIVRIDTATGAVTGRLDLSALAREARKKHRGARELNGIAYDAAAGKVYVTGKMWPQIYEISFAW